MGATQHVTLRLDKELLELVDREAARMRWSRSTTLATCVEFGLVDLEQERPSGRVQRENPEVGSTEVGSVARVESGHGSTDKLPTGTNRTTSIRKVGSERAHDNSGDGVGEKCPHGYMNWMENDGSQKNSMGVDLAIGSDYGAAVVTKDGEVVSEAYTRDSELPEDFGVVLGEQPPLSNGPVEFDSVARDYLASSLSGTPINMEPFRPKVYERQPNFVSEAIIDKPAPVKLCAACEANLVTVKGKWVCDHPGCGMYGQEQRERRS
jgi:hypothetical protein